MNNYNEKSIQTLDPMEHIKRYPGMYIGSKDAHGLLHCVKEIISNSIDEYLNNENSYIEVKLLNDGGVYVRDKGRGIPHGKHESGCSVLQACASIINTGGKFNNATGGSGYNSAGGQHGVGIKAVNALANKFVISTSREGKKEIVEFAKGKFVSYKEEPSNETGVEVLFYPDGTIFETIEFDNVKLQTMIQEFSFLCTGLTFKFVDEKNNIEKTYLSNKGLYDYIKYLSKDKKLLIDPIYFSIQEGQYQVEAAIAYIEDYGNITRLYTNNIPQEKGTHLTGFKTAYTSTFNAFARERNWLKDKDSNFAGSDLEEGQILILNFKMIDPVFKGQNKEELSSSEGRTYVQKLSGAALKDYFNTHNKDIKVLVDKALNARKAREAAKKARDAVRTPKEKKEKLLNLPTKLVDCWSKDREKCELYLVEGNSAEGGLVDARNGELQAVFPLRGKVISSYKNSDSKIFANAEVVSIIKALGLELNPATKKLIYNKSRLRYGRIVLACDADPDGQAIKNLLLALFWWLCPELVINGHISVAIPPLFRVTTKKNEYIYLRDAEALEKYKSEHVGEKYELSRLKGLGEMDSGELEDSILNIAVRNVKQVVVEDIDKTADMLEMFMGPSVPPRRAYILEHSEEAEEIL